jgi:hypothetical protein
MHYLPLCSEDKGSSEPITVTEATGCKEGDFEFLRASSEQDHRCDVVCVCLAFLPSFSEVGQQLGYLHSPPCPALIRSQNFTSSKGPCSRAYHSILPDG